MYVQINEDLSPWRRRFTKTLKATLMRKKSSKARINLNKHWNELENMYGETYQARVTHFDHLTLYNERNDNAINEAREAAATAKATTPPQIPAITRLSSVSSECDDDLPLTPPASAAYIGKPPAFEFPTTLQGHIVDDNLPATPFTPLSPGAPGAWDVFTFPPTCSTPTKEILLHNFN